jgi:F420-dependent oxidoreductase-like protein
VWRRERVQHAGKRFELPLGPARGGSGLGRPLKLINEPVRRRVPMMLAALGPKNVALAAELFEAWQPLFYYPEQSQAAFGGALAEGLRQRDGALGPLQIVADTQLLITDDPDEEARALTRVREHLALYVGGMGARGRNFYNDLVRRYGFEREAASVQDLYLAGRKAEAAAALPERLVRGIALVGDAGRVAERLAAFTEAGITTISAQLLGADHASRLRSISLLKALAS